MTPKDTTPNRLPDTPPPSSFPSGDYSYVLEIVMKMQDTVSQLKEAVTSLKEQSKTHGEKLDQIGKDVHAAKVTMGVVGGLIIIIGGVIAWIINTSLQYLLPHANN